MSKEENLNEKATHDENIKEIKEKEMINKDAKDLVVEKKSKPEKRLGAFEDSVTKFETPQEKRNRKIRLIVIWTLAVIFAIFILFGVIVCINKLNDKVYKNVYLFGQDVSGMTKEQIEEILNVVNNEIKNKKISVYQDTNEILVVTAEELDLKLDVAKTLTDTVGFGRVDNMFINNFKILMALAKPVSIEVSYTYDETKLDNVLKNIDLTIKDRAVDDSYSVDEVNNKLVITRGKTGNSMNYNEEKENLLNTFKDIDNQK